MLKSIILLLKAAIPQRTPQTRIEMDKLVSLVCAVGGFPNDLDAEVSVWTSILHIDADKSFLVPLAIVNKLKRAKTNQLAFGLIEAARDKKRATANPGAITALSDVGSDSSSALKV